MRVGRLVTGIAGTEARKYTELPITRLLLGRTSRTGRFIAKSYMIPLCMRNTRRLQVFGCEQSSHLGPVHGLAGSSQRAPNLKSRRQISSALYSRDSKLLLNLTFSLHPTTTLRLGRSPMVSSVGLTRPMAGRTGIRLPLGSQDHHSERRKSEAHMEGRSHG